MSFGSATERQRHHTNRNIQAGGSGGGSSTDCSRSSGSGDRNGGASTTVEIGNENMTAAAAATTSSDVVTEKSSEKHASVTSTSSKKVRRAFSMPRNPFRWSRKFRTNSNKEVTSSDASISTPGSKKSGRVVEKHSQLSSEEQLANSNNDRDCMLIHLPGDPDNSAGSESSNKKSQSQRSESITSAANRVLRRSSFRKFLTRIAQHVTSVSIGTNKHSSTSNVPDRVPPIGGYQWPPDQTPGVTGLKNHGNTCFMNAVLQCLSHTDILAEYFVLDQYKADLKRRNKLNSRKFGTKGELTEQLANVLKALWTCKNESDHSTSFKAVVDRYGSQFRSSTQHDAQEFLFWLLDKVHEDLNTATKKRYKTIKNSYGRPDEVIAAETLANHIRCNNSFVQAVFQAQFRSSLTCPRCHKQSNTFDPFHCISVQLPQLSQQTIFVNVVYITQHPRQVKLGLTVPAGSPIVALREQLHADTGIAVNGMVLAEINSTGFSRVFCDSQPISMLEGIDSVYCIEIPEMKEETSDLMLLIANVRRNMENNTVERFGTPFCIQVNRDCSYVELQKKLLKEMSAVLKPEVFAYTTPVSDMFQIRIQDPSADPDTYLEQVEHPLFMEIIDMALSVLSSDAGPPHVKLLLEWADPESFFSDMSDPIVEHESVAQLKKNTTNSVPLSLEQCLEHYTKAETLSAENAWRCPNCQQYLPVVKTLGLWSLPDILVVHFKRFRQQHEKGADAAKLTTMVKFPLNAFDMSPHLARGACSSSDSLNRDENGGRPQGSPWRKMTRDHLRNNKDRDKELKDNRYDLYAVCYHQGDTLETGHYTAACKNPYDRQWYKFDDQRVSQVPADQVEEQIINNEAYILFYQRRNIDNSECSGTSSTSGDHWVSRIAPSSVPVTNSQVTANPNANTVAGAATNTSMTNEKLNGENEDETKAPIEVKSDVTNKLISNQLSDTVVIEKTNETELVDVEEIEYADENDDDELKENSKDAIPESLTTPTKPIQEEEVTIHAEDVPELSKSSIHQDLIRPNIRKTVAASFPEYTPQPLWPTSSHTSVNELTAQLRRNDFNCIHHHHYNSDTDSSSNCANLRHSFSTSSNYKLKECDAISSMLRNTAAASSCSKDTLLYIDQQGHSLIDEDDSSYLGSRSLWISPVTPHKLITVSPKN
ncbi:unnamed protein product [Hermetia illucens]|uniref:ubiquitinyl hydrolase 1 n=1 Tax=Hermetia illucens TaxID=343691 RepID=A0A7R8YM78_HERIL|nr:ubiquitin carboxyl-terminal hydrolase 31 [Hermetia illucens]CAD7077202.1 unnamed protein product [Hermetia illucens]